MIGIYKEMIKPGGIRNPRQLSQLKDFYNLKFGSKTPTDIDGFLDFDNKIFIFFELKYGNSQLSYGQNLAYERLCDSLQNAGKETYVIIAKHKIEGNAINVANCEVIKYRHKFKWIFQDIFINLKDKINEIIEAR